MLDGRILRQPFIGLLTSAGALICLAFAWKGISTIGIEPAFLALCLFLAGVLADSFPIHIRHNTKAYVSTIPLYLLAVLLPPHLAGLTAGGVVLTTELVARSRRRSSNSTIAMAAGRWTIIALFGAMVAHAPVDNEVLRQLLLPATALAMFSGDIISASLEIAPLTGEPLRHVVAETAREAGIIEGVQYLLAILGAFGALQEIWTLGLLLLAIAIVYFVFKNLWEIQDGTRRLLVNMADTVDMRDPYTGGHSRRVAEYCADILRELPLTGPEAELIISAARVHDIGKISIPDEILKKPGALTPQERELMESHTHRGIELLSRNHDFARGVEIVRHHHERWDGQGYPSHLQRHDIPLGARVIAVADSYDAMTSDRPYRRALAAEEAQRALRLDQGMQWDPRIVQAFLQSHERKGQGATAETRHLAEPALSRADAGALA